MEIQLKKNIQQSMKRLDLYLIRQFLTILGISILGFTCIFLIVDLIENLDRFIDNTVPWNIVSKYYVYTLPWFFNIALPMAMLIATVFSVGLLVKRNEWTAMKSSGISLYRIAIPLIIIGIIISYASFEFENRVVSSGNQVRSAIEQKYIKKKSRRKMKYVYNERNSRSSSMWIFLAVSNVLKHLNVKFSGVNVLEDPKIRDGIKIYSDWPTIPQLFIKGEFIGGCDIVKEMFEKGDLQKKLKEKNISYKEN